MEDIFFVEEMEMIPELPRRIPIRNDFFNLSDFEFYRTTRFTKGGVRDLTARLEPLLAHENGRGNPITPLHQVSNLGSFRIIYTSQRHNALIVIL